MHAYLPVGNNYAGNIIISSAGLPDNLIATPNINVVPRPLNVTGLSASNKIYDGSRTATITGTPVLVGLIGSEVVTLSGTPIGHFYDSVPATNGVLVTGLSIAGPDAANYTLRELWLVASISPNAPSDLTAVVRPYPNVELNWSDIVGEEKYQIFRKTATDTGYTQISEVAANTTTYTDTGLTSGVTYFYVIRGFVMLDESDDTLFSANSNEASVLVTMPSSLQTVLGNNFSIYPNPSADRVFFTLPNISGEVAIHITDLQGKLISTQVQNVQLNEVALISLQHLITGNYYIQFVTPQGVIVKTIIKE